jgi:protein-S-isoprenylcysteine O-methyltransferase Ste14
MGAAGKIAFYAGTIVFESALILAAAWGFEGAPRRLIEILLAFPMLPYLGLRALEVAVDVFLVRVPERGEGRDPGSVVPLVLTNLAILIGSPWEAWQLEMPWPRPVAVTVVGLAVMAAGAILRLAAVRSLGRHFTAWVETSAEQELVTTGLYSRVRHPGYLAILVFHAGCALTFASVIGLALVVCADLPLLLRRTRIEERAMRERFGADYEAYAVETGRLWPRLRRKATAPGSSPPR